MTETREKGRLQKTILGKEDHGILTCWTTIDFGSSIQGFGGIALDEELAKSYVADLCAAFDVEDWRLLQGKECFALRCFPINNEPIEGLEAPNGKRFILTEWQRKHFPDAPDPLERKRRSVITEIDWAKRRLREAEADLTKIDALYVEWVSKHAHDDV